jgi:hypothetical protein
MDKMIRCLERHAYAPEMNKLWFEDGTYVTMPQCVDLDEAEMRLKYGLYEEYGRAESTD